MLEVKRCGENPLLIPENVKPSREDFKVEGVFNCGVAKYKDEVILLCRVAESVKGAGEGEVRIPVVSKISGKDEITVLSLRKAEHPELDFTDSRTINKMMRQGKRTVYLTSLSHLRVARSKDGIHFTVEDTPSIFPCAEEESWGMEDPRITQIGEVYYINYTSVTENATTAMGAFLGQGILRHLSGTESYLHRRIRMLPYFRKKLMVCIWRLTVPYQAESATLRCGWPSHRI